MNCKRNIDNSIPVKVKKRKHCTLSIAEKVELLKKYSQGTAVRNLCDEYAIGKSTVYDIIKQQKEILSFFADSDLPTEMAKRKTMKNAKNPDLDKVMIDWFKQRRSENVPLTGPMIIAQAKRYHQEMGLNTPCEYTTGWLDKFKKRHGIRQIRIYGEKISADYEAADLFVDDLAKIIQEENLTVEQIYNADETALFWRYVPRKTLATPAEKSATGMKDSRERLTVLACANAAGSHKLKLMVIGKRARPHSFKGVTFSVLYRSNQRAWITKEIFADWYENHFLSEARNHCNSINLPNDAKILLILDNCSAHYEVKLSDEEISQIRFLPANCTSILQPMDCGVFQAFKCHYKNNFLQRMLDCINNEVSISDFVKGFTPKDALIYAARAWDSISKETLKNAWHRLLPHTLFIDDDDDVDDGVGFDGFRISREKAQILELVNYAKNRNINLEESDITEVYDCDKDAPTINQLSDGEILSNALNMTDSSDEDEETDSEQNEEKMSTENLISFLDNAIKGLEQRSFISEQEMMTVYKIREKLILHKPKMKQLSLIDMLKK